MSWLRMQRFHAHVCVSKFKESVDTPYNLKENIC